MTKILMTTLLAAAVFAPQAVLAQTAPAPAAPVASAPAYPAVADFSAAVRGSNAFRTAAQQVQTQYKPQIDAYNTASQPLQAELQRMATEIQTLQNTPNTPQATLQAKATAFQTRRDAIGRQLAPLSAPFERPLAYAEEQISAKMDQAVRSAMSAKRVNILLNPQAATFILPTADLTGDIVTQLNALVPSVSIAVPANWQPGAQGAAAPGGAPATATPAPTTPRRGR